MSKHNAIFPALILFTLVLLALTLSAKALSIVAPAGNIYDEFPAEIEPDKKYVFYNHGYIVEGDNPTPEHPHWGVYDFPAVKKALSDPDYNLIAYHRKAKTNPFDFAKKLASDIRQLIEAGVKAEQIYVLGFSRGGAISILTSDEVKSDKLNTLILAGCSKLTKSRPEIKGYGAIYSIWETSDNVGSCQFLVERSTQVTQFTEIAISTGLSHGAFYRPIPEWLDPIKSWIKGEKK